MHAADEALFFSLHTAMQRNVCCAPRSRTVVTSIVRTIPSQLFSDTHSALGRLCSSLVPSAAYSRFPLRFVRRCDVSPSPVAFRHLSAWHPAGRHRRHWAWRLIKPTVYFVLLFWCTLSISFWSLFFWSDSVMIQATNERGAKMMI
jgi:hypothetical protein